MIIVEKKIFFLNECTIKKKFGQVLIHNRTMLMLPFAM